MRVAKIGDVMSTDMVSVTGCRVTCQPRILSVGERVFQLKPIHLPLVMRSHPQSWSADSLQ
jgi:hypothetical protein